MIISNFRVVFNKLLACSKPALGCARPKAFRICEALIFIFAYIEYYLFSIACFIYILKTNEIKGEQKKNYKNSNEIQFNKNYLAKIVLRGS